jgi:GT2 family glycosyltransferase/glycosyltransferase involved in cell wall biosynthesis
MAAAPPVSVVIPVYNAPEAVEACLTSVLRNTGTAVEIVVIDDASTDPRVAKVLDRFSAKPSVRIVSNRENMGFTATANRGFVEVEGDVILLNSDTEVPPRWVERLRLAAYSDATIATVTPLTNGAGAFSAPSMPGPNILPSNTTVDVIGRLVARSSALSTVDTPTASGFCMYIKRAVLDGVGVFDVANFPRGYGEENDFSMRASATGWNHVVDASTYVLHARASSFGAERESLSQQGMETMDRLHPGYRKAVAAFIESVEMDAARMKLGEALDMVSKPGRGRPRVLYVLHDYGGGTPLSTRDLAEGISDGWEPLFLRSSGDRLLLSDSEGKEITAIRLADPVEFGPATNREYREAVTDLLIRYDIELVHVRHLLKHTLDLPEVADALNIPTVLSFHDFYYSCPTAHLLDNEDRFCAGVCTPGQGICRASPWVLAGPHLKHGWVQVWRKQVEEMFAHVDAFVWTSEWARSLYLTTFRQLDDRMGRVIEHGRGLARDGDGLAARPIPGEPTRVAVLGHVGIHKGADLVREAAELAAGTIEFHIVGTLEGPPVPGIVVHGPYDRDHLFRRLGEIAPSYVLLSSITGETYSHTLTEAWAAGIPVIANELGAPVDRIRAQGGGWVAPLDTGAKIVAEITAISPAAWDRAVQESLQAKWPSVEEMAERYLDLYESVRDRRLTAGQARA